MKLSQEGLFRRSVHTAVVAGLATGGAGATGTAFAQDSEATELEKIEVTGSRLGRADIEGALPVAVITREDIDRSGFTSVGELLRNTTFNATGAFRAQSGSSAQGLVAVDLRGLGSERTLVLIDGHRAPKAPYAPTAQDLNAVPIAIVERIEVLKDGASAIYGSDAIAGVINIITRKDYDGASISGQWMGTQRVGGDSDGFQLVGGVTGERGNIVFGASSFSRDIIFARDSLFSTPGASFFSNNYVHQNFADDLPIVDCDDSNPGCVDDPATETVENANDGNGFDDNTGIFYYGAIPGGCPPPGANPGYFISVPLGDPDFPAGLCGFDFNQVAADEAETNNDSLFVRSYYQISDHWGLNVTGSVARATSFGRYAPSLNDVALTVDAANPNNTVGTDFYLYHRFAALGNRNNETDANVYDLTGTFTGQVLNMINFDIGGRYNEYQFYDIGRNYVVLPIAQSYIDSGQYNFLDPVSGNTAQTLSSMKATIGRDSIWRTQAFFLQMDLPVFTMMGGNAEFAYGSEFRSEQYFDAYDSLSEGGAIGGSAGNSAGTNRKVGASYFELFLPVIDELEVTLSGRYEDYNDVGSSTVPKLSARYQPLDMLTIRASLGQGFRAPTLDIISALPTFSAEAIDNDAQTCAFAGGVFAAGQCSVQAQVNTTIISNPALEPEKSDQFSLGFAVDIVDGVDASIDYFNIAIEDRLNFISPQTIIDRLSTGIPIPAGLGITRSPINGRITNVIAGFANEGQFDTSGIDLAANADLDWGVGGAFKSSFIMSYILDYSLDSGRDQTGEPAIPQYRATLFNSYKNPMVPGLDLGLNMNHIADQADAVDPQGNTSGHIPSYTTWDLQLAYDLPIPGVTGTNLAVGALNIFDREPSAKSSFDGRDYNFYLYDQYGRQPYIKFTQTF